MKLYINKDVFTATEERMDRVFSQEDNILVSCSGGKDSTVLVEMAIRSARRNGRLPINVQFLDQESEYQGVVDYMRYLQTRKEEIKLHWYQIPFVLTNSTERGKNTYLKAWDDEHPELWMREKELDSIHENNTGQVRFRKVMEALPELLFGKNKYFVMVGIRAAESFNRYIMLHKRKRAYKDLYWCSHDNNDYGFLLYPLYDWETHDIWKAISEHGWVYNKIYDRFYDVGLQGAKMRVSSLIHETAHWALGNLQLVEPETYEKMSARMQGVNAYNNGGVAIYAPRTLPTMFATWTEYRDYLLGHLIEDPVHKKKFQDRFDQQTGEDWARFHVKEVILNDFEGTTNKNAKTTIRKARAQSRQQSGVGIY